MTLRTGVDGPLFSATARTAMSRWVMMRTSRSFSATGSTPTSMSHIARAASRMVWSGCATNTSRLMASLPRMVGSCGGKGRGGEGRSRRKVAGPIRLRGEQRLVVTNVVLSHPLGREALLEVGADAAPVELAKAPDRANGLLLAVHDKDADAVTDDLRHRARPEGDDGPAAQHGVAHHQAKRFQPEG